jgi:hypothetical protein
MILETSSESGNLLSAGKITSEVKICFPPELQVSTKASDGRAPWCTNGNEETSGMHAKGCFVAGRIKSNTY